ncbi:MAG: 4-hydroxy-tetrahydrodipicolinate reductase [Oscillospiraceae bacterium]|jgi:4-hydroxy-tetrahydrodipicolinate reductase|nr:4-hydroxy-tetrahydrodipicolinate reductase [Oscillospiraceae bacterium]
MIRIILSGAGGRMGRAVAAACDQSCVIAAGVDSRDVSGLPYPIYKSVAEVAEQADVIVDFSHPDAVYGLLDYARTRALPLVLATTGYAAEHDAAISAASLQIPVIRSSNFSVGVSVLMEIVSNAASLLPGADIEIVESHHRMKADSPSGTALTLIEAIKEVSPCRAVLAGRRSEDGKREQRQIGVHSVRGGLGAGDHNVMFLLDGETIEIRHTAHGRDIFAQGALQAAKWIAGKSAGLYSMRDILGAM